VGVPAMGVPDWAASVCAAGWSSGFRALSARVRTWRPLWMPRTSTVEPPVRTPSAPNSPTVLIALPLAGMPGSRNPCGRCVPSRSPGRGRAPPGRVPRTPISLRPRVHRPGRGARVCEPLASPARGSLSLLDPRDAGLDRPLPQAPCLDRILQWRAQPRKAGGARLASGWTLLRQSYASVPPRGNRT